MAIVFNSTFENGDFDGWTVTAGSDPRFEIVRYESGYAVSIADGSGNIGISRKVNSGTGNYKLSFWAKNELAEHGRELEIQISASSGSGAFRVRNPLTPEWQEYQIDLVGVDVGIVTFIEFASRSLYLLGYIKLETV